MLTLKVVWQTLQEFLYVLIGSPRDALISNYESRMKSLGVAFISLREKYVHIIDKANLEHIKLDREGYSRISELYDSANMLDLKWPLETTSSEPVWNAESYTQTLVVKINQTMTEDEVVEMILALESKGYYLEGSLERLKELRMLHDKNLKSI